jgi:hypothetical protein
VAFTPFCTLLLSALPRLTTTTNATCRSETVTKTLSQEPRVR